MTPAQFLVQVRSNAAASASSEAGARRYHALMRGEGTKTFLSFHAAGGEVQVLPYNALHFITGNDTKAAPISLVFNKMHVVIQGHQLAAVLEGIRSRTVAHLYEFTSDRYDSHGPGEPVITELAFEIAAKSNR